jgi:hypothetical protein
MADGSALLKARVGAEADGAEWVPLAHAEWAAPKLAAAAGDLAPADPPEGYGHAPTLAARVRPLLGELAALAAARGRGRADGVGADLALASYPRDGGGPPLVRAELVLRVGCPSGGEEERRYLVPSPVAVTVG